MHNALYGKLYRWYTIVYLICTAFFVLSYVFHPFSRYHGEHCFLYIMMHPRLHALMETCVNSGIITSNSALSMSLHENLNCRIILLGRMISKIYSLCISRCLQKNLQAVITSHSEMRNMLKPDINFHIADTGKC